MHPDPLILDYIVENCHDPLQRGVIQRQISHWIFDFVFFQFTQILLAFI